MDPYQQYTGYYLLWIYLSSLMVFLFGIWQTKYISKKLSISQTKGLSLYIWHTIFCIVHFLCALVANNDVIGTYINSLDPSFNFGGQEQLISNIFILNFYRIFSYYLKFSFFTTFLSINIIGSNAILLIEYFYQKYSKNLPRTCKLILGLFVWLPTLHFWTALGKDALIILGILLITFSLEKINKRYLIIIPSLIVVTCLRSYISIMVVISALFSIVLTTSSIKQSSKIILIFFSLFSLIIIYPLVNSFLFTGNLANKTITEVFTYNINVTSLGTYSISPDINPFLRIFAYSLRPIFYDVKNLFGLIISFDNFILLIIFIFSIIVIFKVSDLKLSISDQLSIYCAAFSLSLSFLLSQSTSNLGIAARHKWMFLPVGFILILKIFKNIYDKKILNSKKIKNSILN